MLGTFTIPKNIALRPLARMLLQALLDAGHGIRRHVHPSIFAPFPLHDLQGLLLPIDLLQLEVGHLGDPETTAEDHQKQRAVHRMGDLGKEPLDLLAGRALGGDAHAGQSGWASRDSHAPAAAPGKRQKVLQRIEPPVDRRPGPVVVMLAFHKLVDLAKRDLGQGHGDLGKEQAQIQGVIRDGMRRELRSRYARNRSMAV